MTQCMQSDSQRVCVVLWCWISGLRSGGITHTPKAIAAMDQPNLNILTVSKRVDAGTRLCLALPLDFAFGQSLDPQTGKIAYHKEVEIFDHKLPFGDPSCMPYRQGFSDKDIEAMHKPSKLKRQPSVRRFVRDS
jgi:hypothetical protein